MFICTANQFRSPVAAFCLRQELERTGLMDGWTVESAGTWPQSNTMSPEIIRALRPLGMNLEHHIPRPVDEDLLMGSDLILVMESGQKEALETEYPFTRGRVFLLAEVAEGIPANILDPVVERSQSLLSAASGLCALVRQGASNICALAQDLQRKRL